MGVRHNLLMPKLGLTMTEGTLTEWRVEPGQPARQGEVLFVVETEKVAKDLGWRCCSGLPQPGRRQPRAAVGAHSAHNRK
jgi:Biotin-requiring enzyme